MTTRITVPGGHIALILPTQFAQEVQTLAMTIYKARRINTSGRHIVTEAEADVARDLFMALVVVEKS